MGRRKAQIAQAKRTPHQLVVPERQPVTKREQVDHAYAERNGYRWQPGPPTAMERAWADAERED